MKKDELTLWTSTMSKWTKVLEGIEFSEALEAEVRKTAEGFQANDLKDRIKAYETPVTEATFSNIVG
jgi:uncharacterized cupin superfamily protein